MPGVLANDEIDRLLAHRLLLVGGGADRPSDAGEKGQKHERRLAPARRLALSGRIPDDLSTPVTTRQTARVGEAVEPACS